MYNVLVALRCCCAVKFDSCSNLPSSVHGVVHKGRPQKMTPFHTPVRRCPHLTNPLPRFADVHI